MNTPSKHVGQLDLTFSKLKLPSGWHFILNDERLLSDSKNLV